MAPLATPRPPPSIPTSSSSFSTSTLDSDLYVPTSTVPLLPQQVVGSSFPPQPAISHWQMSATKQVPHTTSEPSQQLPQALTPLPHLSAANSSMCHATSSVPPAPQRSETSYSSPRPTTALQSATKQGDKKPAIKLNASQRVCISGYKLAEVDTRLSLQEMIMQALQLRPETINALPQSERDAVQFLVSCFSRSGHPIMTNHYFACFLSVITLPIY